LPKTKKCESEPFKDNEIEIIKKLRGERMDETEFIWMNGEFVKWEDAKVHVLTHTLHYGTGVFEGIRCYETDLGPGVFRLTEHIERLMNSAKLIGMKDVPFTGEQIVEATKELIKKTNLKAGYIRPIIYYGYGKMGLDTKGAIIDVSISTWPWGAYLGEEGMANGIRVVTSPYLRHDNKSIPSHAKATGGYVTSMMAKMDALNRGYDEALMKNANGFVAEGSGENIFIAKEGKLITPRVDYVLPGITRDSLIELAKDEGIKTTEADLTLEDIYSADELFMCGTAAELTPIREVDDKAIGTGKPGPITQKLQELYKNATHGKNEKWKDWIELV
jgi:branched-chain amino acid aminotransferase